MQATPKTQTSGNPTAIRKADPKILKLFPSLNFAYSTDSTEKKVIIQRVTCLKLIGNNPTANLTELSTKLKVTRAKAAKITKELTSLSLVRVEKNKTTMYSLTTAGYVALMAFEDFREWAKVKSVLAVHQKKNDPLAYALLVVGFCANQPKGVYEVLCQFASMGNTFENVAVDVAAETLLGFYRHQLQAKSSLPPAYLNVFKEFTTAGFQEVFKMLLLAVKPTAEDYNWLVEFFNEVSEFYFDPARIAFVNLLPESQKLRQDLEAFKIIQDQQIKKQDGSLEVTFIIPGSGLSKIDAMPPHLRVIGMRLILEPIKFINKELIDYFWAN
jgi:DNA-binding MarR family transcriptional regulator